MSIQTALKGFWGAAAQQLCSLTGREEQATGKGATLFTLLRCLDKKVLTRCSGWTSIEELFPSSRKKKTCGFQNKELCDFLSFYYREPSQMLDIIPPSILLPYDSCNFSMTFFLMTFLEKWNFLTLNLVTISMIYNSGLNSSFWEWACLKSYDLTLLWLFITDFDSYNLLWV